MPEYKKNLPSFGQTSTSKDVDGIICDIACEPGRLHLEESDLPSQVSGLFLV